jgi:hypothetical protein
LLRFGVLRIDKSEVQFTTSQQFRVSATFL